MADEWVDSAYEVGCGYDAIDQFDGSTITRVGPLILQSECVLWLR